MPPVTAAIQEAGADGLPGRAGLDPGRR